MKTLLTLLLLCLTFTGPSADTPAKLSPAAAIYEYATVRWAGDRTTIIWPDGTTDKVIPFAGKKRPVTVDDKAWYMTGALNIMAKRGFEIVQLNNDDLVMRRPAIAEQP